MSIERAASERIIVKMVFGSHLYGTDTPASDRDFKGVFIPARRSLLIQQAPHVHTTSTRPSDVEKNTAADTDTEIFALHKYVKLLLEGQTVALDMLFAPPNNWINRHAVWREVVGRPSIFLSRRCTAFVGYCQMQAAKYGVKGSRVAAVRAVLALLSEEEPGPVTTLGHYASRLEVVAVQTEHVSVIEMPSRKDGPMEPALDVCNRKFGFNLKAVYVKRTLEQILGEYGKRALAAEKNEGVDWKALSHAVRVTEEAKQLLRMHMISFPLACADLLRDIKVGKYQYRAVAEMIEQGLVDVAREQELSTLPDEPNAEAAWDLVAQVYEAEAK